MQIISKATNLIFSSYRSNKKMPWSMWGCCNQEHVTGDNVLAVLWLLRRTSVTYLEKILYLSWPEFSPYTVFWGLSIACAIPTMSTMGKKDIEKRRRDLNVKEQWGCKANCWLPEDDFRWHHRHQKFMFSRPSDALDNCPFIKYI